VSNVLQSAELTNLVFASPMVAMGLAALTDDQYQLVMMRLRKKLMDDARHTLTEIKERPNGHF
jgi:hypothetical protein